MSFIVNVGLQLWITRVATIPAQTGRRRRLLATTFLCDISKMLIVSSSLLWADFKLGSKLAANSFSTPNNLAQLLP